MSALIKRIACGVLLAVAAVTAVAETKQPVKSYVGVEQCGSCHQQQVSDWRDSHHDLAMQEATSDTVLGNFDNSEFDYFGTVSRFYTKDDGFYVETDGPDGELREYQIAYTFGVYPLQQYLIRFPQGKLQALNIVWDTRPQSEGGQRWYHLYPDEPIRSGDELHWTGLNHNWNFMCADCHSTNLQKNYDLTSQTYTTQWSEIDVSCEACHGPASAHIDWAKGERHPSLSSEQYPRYGFDQLLDERQGVNWLAHARGTAERSELRAAQKEIDTCASCHSRRGLAHPDGRPGNPFLDHYNLSLLDEGLYHADGQINDEVYVYGSFLQSKMYQQGVTCSDCHNPHSLKLKAEGNQVCTQCHQPQKFETQEHIFHKFGSDGSQCVDCHMPAKNYMGVDARRDHSLRIPRPDLSVKLGTPNACTQCHQSQSDQWAVDELEQRFGKPDQQHFATAIHAGRTGSANAEQLLIELVMDKQQPQIARATAASLLPGYFSRLSASVLQQLAQSDEEPLITLGLADSLEQIPPQYRHVFAVPLLYDGSQVTRDLAANAIPQQAMSQLPGSSLEYYDRAVQSYVDSQKFNADRPESLTNLANHYLAQGDWLLAKDYYQQAMALAPYFTPAYINLAAAYQSHGDEPQVVRVLQQGLTKVHDPAALNHALGLSYVRQKDMPQALKYLRLAAENGAHNPRYPYVYAVALNSAQRPLQALSVLEKALEQHPNDQSILSALISINREQGNQEQVRYYQSLM